MRSLADTVPHRRSMPARVVLEWACRAAAIGLLAWALLAAVRRDVASPAATVAARLDTADASAQLGAWSRRTDLARVHLSLESVPPVVTRDWLRALDHAGTRVTWTGAIPATAIAAERRADPRGGSRIGAAAPDGMFVVVEDAVGRIDSVEAMRGGASVRAPSTTGIIAARAGGVTAAVGQPPGREIRELVVLGRAGWEAKFVTAALEEQGWRVSTRFRVAPGLAVGAVPRLDTAGIAAVIALDSTAADQAPAIAAYVRSGGGLVLGNAAARLAALATLAPGRPGASVPGASSFAAAIAPVTRLTLAHAAVVALKPDAVPLERRGDTVLVAARRVDAGRVVQLGYDETWRWRMAGAEDSPEAHRTWWASLVESVAYAPLLPSPVVRSSDSPPTDRGAAPPGHRGPPAAVTLDAAPRAALVAALGAPASPPGDAESEEPFDPSRSLPVYIAAALLLLVEWGSRRLRGRM